ncbi:MAG: DUF805 domain-containing protein [Bacteroidales bacterium]|nr:DUF805 domain-containing protein [Bacteroidales bacterium]
MRWYLLGFKNFLNFRGRAVRKEFWMFMLVNILLLIAALIIDNTYFPDLFKLPFAYCFPGYLAVILIPAFSVTIRRLHDVGNTGWILLLTLIPVIGVLWILSILVRDSNPKENIFGSNPKVVRGSRPEKEFPADTLILIFVGWMLLVRAYYAIMLKYFPDFFTSLTFAVSTKFIALIWAVIPLSLAFAIRERNIQLVVFFAGGIYLTYSLYSLVVQII